jgi:hypothetical protein
METRRRGLLPAAWHVVVVEDLVVVWMVNRSAGEWFGW